MDRFRYICLHSHRTGISCKTPSCTVWITYTWGHCLVRVGTAKQVILVPKTSNLLGVGERCISQWIASDNFKFCALLEFPFIRNWIASEKLQSPARYETVCLKRRGNDWSWVRCVSPLTSFPLHPRSRTDQAVRLGR